MKRLCFFFLAFGVTLMLLFLALFPTGRRIAPASAAPNPQHVVQRAWELVRQAGSYSFTAQVDQVSIPLPLPSNVGRHSQQQSALLEGTTNLAERKMDFTLNSTGGSVLDKKSGTEIKIEGDHAYSRQGQQAWQKIDDFTGAFAPQSDFMAFLAGARNIQLAEPAGENGVARYTFEVDGPGFAAYMRDGMMQQLTSQGKIPIGVEVNISEALASLTGTGEIWIAADGLPVRQALHLQFPPGSADQVQADVQVNFRDFGPLPAAPPAPISLLEQVHKAIHSPAFRDFCLAASALALGMFTLLLGLRRKPVYVALIITLVVAMLIGPILQSAQAAAFTQEQFAEAQRQEQNQQVAQAAQDLAQPAARFSPHTSPLAAALAARTASSAAPSSITFPAPVQQSAPQAVASTQDSDSDGLPDDQENLLGTDPAISDTDSDTISDFTEVTGIVMGGQTWYGDPRNQDTNGDGIGDNREWGKDTDGDLTPDLWDEDNDKDGVPDKTDLSPFSQGVTSYDGVHPFSLSFQNLTANTPTYVEIQLRPANPAHLRYTNQVLDWPTGDVSGQMMDLDGLTFKDVNPDSTLPQDSYGDVKLVPMLEIHIDGSPTNLPDQATLDQYGISVHNLTQDGSQKVAYVPLQVVSETGDNWVAFYAKMFYLPGDSWGKAQQVRLAWLVEGLVDICADEGMEDGSCTEFETLNDLAVIQTYYDAFTLTGLNVREDHGTQWELVYKDPLAITENPKTQRINEIEPLSDLVFGLDHSFLAGRVDEKTGLRDFPVTEIRQRFDHTINASVPISPTRFSISDNILRVNPYQYTHIDQAYASIAITETRKILDIYTPYWSVSSPITPTILFAHEEYFRPLNLDLMGAYSNISVSPDGSQYSISLPSSVPAGSSLAPIELFTATALSWAPYMYQDGEWKGAPLNDYLAALSSIYPPDQINSDPSVAQGALMFLQTYYANIYQGYFNFVEQGEQILESVNEEFDEVIAEYLERFEMVYEPIKVWVETAYEMYELQVFSDALANASKFFRNIYSIVVNGKITGLSEYDSFQFLTEFSKLEGASMLGMVIAAVAWLVTHIPKIYEKMDATVWGEVIIITISASFAILVTIKTVASVMRLVEEFGSMAASKAGESGIIGLIIVTVLIIAATIGIFIYVWVTNRELINGVLIGLMFANLFAQIVVILLFAFISAIPWIGPIIMAIYSLVNTILTEVLGFSITEFLVEQIAYIFDHIDPMVSLDPIVGQTVVGFLFDRGIAVNNGVNLSFPMDVVARQEGPQTTSEQRISNDRDADLYATRVSLTVDDNLSAVTSNSQWKDRFGPWEYRTYDNTGNIITFDYYGAHAYLTGTLDTIQFTQAGINQSFSYDSNFYFKIHYWRCVLLIFCNDKTADYNNEGDDTGLIFDVFPATVDDFMAWNWDANLPSLSDRDNDGLLGSSVQGNDPDDTQWDTDGDGLSDQWEITMAARPAIAGGYAFNPRNPDTDNDGLKDGEEARWGANPAVADSDGDGRSDFAELDGYNFMYATGKMVKAYSYPHLADSDGDGMDDKVEYSLYTYDPVQFPFNPTVWNTVPLALQVQAGVEGYIAPNATFPLTITLQNSSATPIQGDVTTILPAGITAVNPGATTYEVQGKNSTSLASLIQVDPKPPASGLKISSSTCGTVEKPLVYLPFDEASGATTFYNTATLGRYDMLCQGASYCPLAGVNGWKGSAVQFTGAIQSTPLTLSSPDLVFSNKHPFSIAVWVYPSTTTRTDKFYLVSQASSSNFSSGYDLYFTTDAQHNYITHFATEAKEYVFSQPILPSQWTSLIATFDGTNQRLFINGVEATGTLAANVVMSPSTATVWIGGLRSANFTYLLNYLGRMDELRIYDRVVSASEIDALSSPNSAQEVGAIQLPANSTCELTASQEITVTVDTDLPTVNITSPQYYAYLDGSGYQVVGGEAHDPTSFIRSVEVSLDGGAFVPAAGLESWAYTWDMRSLADGAHLLYARARDAVGNVSSTSQVKIYVDRTAPALTWDFWDNAGYWPRRITFRDTQTWVQPIAGSVSDAYSGVASVQVLFDGGSNLPYGGWQSAAIDLVNHRWTLDYKFPTSVTDLHNVPDPSGNYTLSIRTTDNIGNTTILTNPQPAIFHNEAPSAVLTNLSPTAIIQQPLTLSGVITDTLGASRLDIAVIPVEQLDVLQDPALVMHLNEGADSNKTTFMDASGHNQTGTSDSLHAPWAVHTPGKVDEAVMFSGTGSFIRWPEPLTTVFTDTLTAAMWINVQSKYPPLNNTTLMSLDHAAAFYWKTAGGLTFSVTDRSGLTFEASSNRTLADGLWHHVLGAWNGAKLFIYIDGVLVASTPTTGMGLMNTSSSLLTLANSSAGVNGFGGNYGNNYMDEFYLFPRGFTEQEAANLYALGNTLWQPALLDSNQTPVSNWTYTLPAVLEGYYEIAIRGSDNLGNRDDNPASWNAWQGEIDLGGPRLSLHAVNQGVTTQVDCSATDFNLSRNGYQCPCPTLEGDLTTYDQVDNWYKEVIVDQTRLYKIMSKCSVPTGTPLSMQACDTYGICSTATATASPEPAWTEALLQGPPAPAQSPTQPVEASVTSTPSLLPISRLIAPPAGSQVSSQQPLTLTLQTEAISGLRQITVTLDGNPLTTLDFPDASLTSTLTTIPWTPPVDLADGAHVLNSSALDWADQVQAESFPITLYFTAQPPVVEVNPIQTPEPGVTQPAPPPRSAVIDPPDRTVFTAFVPMDLTIAAQALSGLQRIDLSLDGSWLWSIDFPDSAITQTLLTVPWTPDPNLTDGAHTFQTIALDWAGAQQSEPIDTTIFLDSQPPTLEISPTVLTSTQMIANWGVELGGPASDLAGLSSVEVAQQDSAGNLAPVPGPPGARGNPWNPASVVGDRWNYPFRPDVLPDGQVINVAVRATDLAGHIQQVITPVTMDLVAPTTITMTVSYINSQGILTQVLPGQAILDVLNPTLLIDWTPASDGSGVRSYYVGLSQQDPPDLASLATVSPSGPLQFSQAASEAQEYTAFVVSEDIYGNRSWNSFGPIDTDTPLTPDLIALPTTAADTDIYHGWMDSGEAQIGINRILAEMVPPGFSLNADQKFYLSWDATALRLAWLGANWNSEGDLFVYMNTGSGAGSNQAYNPYPATLSDTLTLPMFADTLLWVTGSQSAHLMHWNGAAWFDALPGGLGPEYFRFTAYYPKSVTDLYLPFSMLGITDPAATPLDLIAFGSQENALRLWTVFPINNPHNSPILSRLLQLLPDQQHLVMKHAYHWLNLALSQSPNSSRFVDVDVRSLMMADPLGVITDTRQSGLYLSDLFPFSQTAPLIGDGQLITYTLYYLNIGGASTSNAPLRLIVNSLGPLILPGGQPVIQPDGTTTYLQEIDLGPILPGSRGTVQFTGLVNLGPLQAQYLLCLRGHPRDPGACQALHDFISTAGIDAILTFSSDQELVSNHFTIKHPVVVDPPTGVAILAAQGETGAAPWTVSQADRAILPADVLQEALASPPIFVRSGVNTLQGSAYDPSGVSSVTVQILDPPGDKTDATCSVTAPMSAGWSCAVNLPPKPDGSRYFARARAANPFGYTSDWSAWRVLVIDSLPPTVGLDPASELALTGAVINSAKTHLSGQIQDNDQVKSVDLCLGPVAKPGAASPPTGSSKCRTIALNTNNVTTGTWSATLETPLGVDHASQKLFLYGMDAAGNRSSLPVELTIWFDTVAPQVSVTYQIPTVSLGDYLANPAPLLAGTASDGSGQVVVVVRLTSPTYGTQRTVTQVQDGEWSYLPDLSMTGAYTLRLEAWDAAGNLTTLGPWTLVVNPSEFKLWMPVINR
jgi:hypothetical protein